MHTFFYISDRNFYLGFLDVLELFFMYKWKYLIKKITQVDLNNIFSLFCIFDIFDICFTFFFVLFRSW